MKFEQVDPSAINNLREGRRGRVSYPILKGFMETGYALAKLDRTGINRSTMSLTVSLNTYIANHKLPIKCFIRGGEIYLLRLDLNEDGTPKADWKPVVEQPKEEIIPSFDENMVDEQFANASAK